MSFEFAKTFLTRTCFIILVFVSGSTFAQATFVKATYQTLSQQEVDVAFSQTISFSDGLPHSTTGWSVTVGGTVVPIISVNTFGTTVVRVKFDASSVAGHGATEVFVKPGETVTVSYNNTGTLTSTGGVTAFAGQSATNSWVFDCSSDIAFYQETDYTSTDQCAPVVMNFHQWQYRYSLRYRNSSNWSAGSQPRYIINWGDGTPSVSVTPYQSDLLGNANAIFIDPSSLAGSPNVIMTIRPSHTYPSANPTDCSFNVNLTPSVVFVTQCLSAAKQTIFATYDTDKQNSGTLALPPPLVAGTDQVCKGNNVNMMFNDNTTLNCRIALEPIVPNQFPRWVRFVYGSQDNGGVGNIPDIRVTLPASMGGGTVQITNNDAPGSLIFPTGYYPTGAGGNNAPDGFGVIQIPSPVTAATGTTFMATITTSDPSNQVVNQKFWIRLEYWDVCNPYSGDPTSPAPVTSTAAVTIISNNLAPSISPLTFCANQANSAYSMTATTNGPSAGGIFKWYSDASLTTLRQTGASYNPVSSAPNINKTPTNATTTNFYVTETVGNGCVSPATSVPFTIDPVVVPGTIVYPGLSPQCTGYDPPPILGDGTSGSSIASKGDGVTYTYQWQDSPDNTTFTNISGATGLNYDPPTITSTRYYRRVASSGPCASQNSNVITIQIDQPVNGGTVGSNQTICTGSAPASFTSSVAASGGNGTFTYQWQSSTVSAAGPFTAASGTSNAATYTSPALTQTTYFRRQATSGVCSSASGNPGYSNVITITVDQAVAGGTISSDQILCSGSTPIPLTQVIAASGGDGATYSYIWQQSTVSSTGPFVSASGTNNNGAVYTVPAITQTTYYRRQATSGVCTPGFSNVVTITINPLPTAATPTGGGAVCSGNPAPDVVWALTGAGPYTGTWTDGTTTFSFAAAGVSQTSTELRVSSPNTLVAGTYRILSLTDANGCTGTSLGGTTSITIGGTAPSLDPGSLLSLTSTCDNGASTADPSLTISLDDAGSSNTGPFTLTYKIDGGSSRTKSFNTGANGNPTSAITFTDTELNNTSPSPHVISLVSLLSPFGCQTTLANTYNFTVNALPALPTGAVNGIACSNPGIGVPISVTSPGGGLEIAWSTTPGAFTNAVPGSGSVGASPFNVFTPIASATATYYAFTKNSATGCLSSTSLAVTETQDNKPTNAVAGGNQNICASASLVTLAATTPDNSGIGSWSVINKVAYYQNFEDFTTGTTSSSASNGWSRDVGGANAFPQQGGGGYFEVKAGKRFEAQNTNGTLGGGAGNMGEVVWTSQTIDISGISSVTASVDIINVSNDLDAGADADYVKVSYKLNGGAETTFPTNGNLSGNFSNSTATVTGLSGSTLTIIVRLSANAATETIAFDNVFVKDSSATAITFSDPNSATATVTGLPAPVPGGSPIVSTLRWTVASALGVCSASFSDMTVTINPLPTVTDPAPQLCEDVAGGGSHAAVDLTSYNAIVTNASTVAWFTNAARTTAVATPTNVTVNNITAKTFYFRATSAASCTNDGTLTFTVNSLPQATNQNLTFCEDFPIGSNQHTSIDLTANNNSITGGTTNRTVAWFSDSGLTTAIATPTNYTLIGTKTVYAKVTNTLTGCVNISTVSLVLNPRPLDNPITGNGTVCASSTTIQLYQVDPTKNPGSNYTWTVSAVPAGAAQVFGGGGTNSSNFFVLVKFPISGTVTITMAETLNGCVGNTSSFVININNAPSAIAINGLTEVCTNQTGVVYTVPGANASSTYTWTASGATFPGASSGVGLSTVTIDYGVAPSATVGVTETSSTGCVGSPASINVNVNSRPSMTSVNASTTCSQVVPSLVFTSSLPSTYSWTVMSVSGTLTGVAVGNTGTGNITTLITNKSGATGFVAYDVTPKATAAPNCAGSVQAVTITVNPEPVLVSPQTKTICSGQAVGYEIQLTPAALPTGTVFNWPDPDGSGPATAGVNVPAGSSGTIHINDILTNTTSSANTINYVVTPTSGSCVGNPVTVAITVNPEPIVATGLDAIKCSDSSIGLTLSTATGSASAANYNVISKTVAGGLVGSGANAIVPAAGVSSNYLTNDQYTNTTTGSLTVSYTVTAVTAAGCTGAIRIINITINPEPVLSSTLDAIVCSGSSIGVNLSTNVTSVSAGSYSIVGKTVASGLVAGGSNAVVPASGVALNYIANDKYTNTGNTSLTVVYQISAVSSLGCIGNPPQAVTITILPEPVVATNLNASVCSRAATGLTLNTNGTSIAASSYDISASSVDVGLLAGGSNAFVPIVGVPAGYLSNDVFTNTTSSPLFVTYTVVGKSAAGCSGAQQLITITINPEPVLSSSLNTSSCSDVAHGLLLNTNGTSVAAATYNITARTISGGLTANVANVAVPATGVVANYLGGDIFTNTTANPLTVTYTVIPVSASGCLGAPKVISIIINPEPVLSTTLDASVCSITPIGLTLATNGSSVAASTYNVTNVVIAGGLSASPGNALVPANGVSSGYLANDIYTNVGSTALTVKYTVVPVSAGGCLGDSKVITMTLNPEPIMSNSLDATVCSSSSIGLTLNTNGTSAGAANYNITSVSIPSGVTGAVTNAVVPATNVVANYLSTDKYTNTGSSVQIVSYTVVPISAAGCPGPSKLINISINPEPVVSSALDAATCSDVVTGLILNTDGSSVAAANYSITARTIAGGLTPASTNVTAPSAGVASTYLTNDKFTNTTSLPLNVTYTVVPISAAGCSGNSKLITIIINPEPVVSSGLDNAVCSDTSIGLNLTTTPTSALAINYNITSRTIAGGLVAGGSNAMVPALSVAANYLSNDTFTNNGTTSLTVTYTVVPVTADNCLGDPKVITITINPAPVVSALLDATICSKSATSLTLNTNGSSVAAANYNITSRTIASGLTVSGFNAVVPATAVAAFYLSNDKFTNLTNTPLNVTYTVVPVSAGGCQGQPEVITITVNPEPVLSTGLNTQTCSGVTAGLILNTNGTSVVAQNYNITAITVAGGLIVSGTNATVPASGVNANYLSNDVFKNTGASNLTVIYSVVPVSAAGCAGNPVNVTITIQPEPVVSSSLDETVCSKTPINLVLNTNGTSVAAASYNAIASAVDPGLVADGGNATVPASGVTASYFINDKFVNTTNSVLTVTYTVIPKSAANCLGAAKTITVNINPEPVVANGLDNTVCSDTSIGLTLSTNGSSINAANYNITSQTIDSGLLAAGSNAGIPANGVIALYLSGDKFTNTTLVAHNVAYTVVPVSGLNCIGDSKVITITINPEPVVASGLDKTACSDNAIGLIMNSDAGSVAAASYNIIGRTVNPSLTSNGASAVIPANGVSALYLNNDQFTNTTNGALTVTYSVVPVSAAGCLGDTKIITITINPEPVIATNLDATVCSGSSVGLVFTTNGSSAPAANYNVTSINVAAGLVADGGNKSTANAVAANFVSGDKFLNVGNSTLTVVYTVVPISADGCLGDPKNITISIDPQPVVSAALDKTICSSTPITLVLNTNGTSVGAANYKILDRLPAPGLTADLSNVAVPQNNVAANYLTGDKFTNVTSGPLTVVYQVVPVSAAGCEGALQSITVTVNPEPVLSTNLDKNVCSDEAGGIVLNTNGSSVAAANYNITSVTIPSGLTVVSAATVPQTAIAANYLSNDAYNNKGNSPLIVLYTVVPVSADGCQGTPVVVKQTVNPEPVLANLSSAACSDLPISLTLNTNGTSVAAANYAINSIIVDGGLTAAGTNSTIPALNVPSNYLFNDKFTNVTNGSLNVTYNVTPKSASLCVGDPLPIVISIQPKPVLATNLNQIICSRNAGGIVLNTNGISVAATNYNITAISADNNLTPATGNAIVANGVAANYLSNDRFTNTTSGNLTVTYTVVPVSISGCKGDPYDVVLTVRPEPVIDPALSSATACSRLNSGIVFSTNGVSIAAVNYDVTLVSKDSGLIGTVTTGTGLSANAIQNDHYLNTGAVPLKVVYSVTPYSADGCIGQPLTITLSINPEPVVSTGLDNTVCSKEVSGITLSTNGSVGASSYKLVSLNVPLAITADGGNAAVNQTGGVSLIKSDKYINTTSLPVVVVYGISGISATGCEGQPRLINLTINPEPILSPGFVSVCSNVASGIVLGSAVGSAPIDHYILKQVLVPSSITAAGTNAGLGTYATTNFLGADKFVNTTSSPVIVTYTIAPISSGCVGNDQTVLLTVNPAPAVATNLSRTVCSGATSGIVLATTATSVPAKNYNITSVVIAPGLVQASGSSAARNGVNPTEIISDSFNNTTSGVRTVTYTIVPVSNSGCLGPAQTVVLTVEPKIIAAPANNKPNICSNDVTSIDLISASVPSSGPVTFSYTATSSIGGQISGFVAAASNLPVNTKIADNLVNGSSNPATVTYSITAIANGARGGSGCSGTPVTVSVKVEPKPNVSASPSLQTVCEGNASNILLTTTTVPSSGAVKFNVLSVVASPGLTLTSPVVAKTVYSNNESIADVWSNSTTTMQTVTYTIQAAVSGGLGCIGNQITVTLNVNPLPNVTATPQAPICSNDLVNITLTSDVSNTINTWTASLVSGTATGFSASGAGDLIFQTVKNTGSIPAILKYSITPKANNCVGPVITTNVQVDPIPDILGVPSSVNVCYGNTLNVPLSSSVSGTTFAWTVDPAANFESVPAIGSGATINQVMNNSSTSSDYLTYSITATGPGATACQSLPKSMTVIAAPQMSGQFLNTDTWLCLGNKDFLQIQLDGQAPFTLVYNDGSSNITLTKVGNFKSIQIQPTATQTFKLVSMTDALNCTIPLTSEVNFTVGDTDPTFSIITPLAHCSPYTPQFKYNQVAGVEYTWRWGDGSPDSTYIATTTLSGVVLKHGFINPSPTQTLKPKVTLEVDLPAPFPGCIKSSTQTLNIYPQLNTLISQNKIEMCSGETVSFTNQTAGATINTWYYRELGNTSQQLEPKSTRFVSYTMTNTSNQNPITYEVYYKADNNLCPADTTLQVKVYRAITANFNEGTVPPFIGGNSTVTFTNTSTPVDDTQFRYDWDFGTDGTPGTATGKGPYSVNYSSPGPRDIVLTATNISAETAGLSCYSSFIKTINVQLLPLIADFDADPKSACYPGDLKVSVNNSTGDSYSWRVVDQNGSIIATSDAALPVFRISAPGKFSIILITSSSSTGQQATKTLDGFEFYDLPVAAFIARPSLVYVPDTEVTTFNSSINSTSWLWDFGDGASDTEFDAKHTYKVEGIYDLTLIAMNDHGNGIICKDTAQQKIIAKQGGQTKIPNAFTPSPNGPSGGATSGSGSTGGSTLNDVFLPIVKGVEEFNMQIFDRWGNLIFESNNQNVGWDGYDSSGKLLPAGVYVYKLTLRLSDNQRTTQIGDVTMIR
jgi:gliding motility-associated-like protein